MSYLGRVRKVQLGVHWNRHQKDRWEGQKRDGSIYRKMISTYRESMILDRWFEIVKNRKGCV